MHASATLHSIFMNCFRKLVLLSIALGVDGREHYLENIHYPERHWPSTVVNGTQIPDRWTESPDFRMEENEWHVWKHTFYREENRPYRMSPFYKSVYRWVNSWQPPKENPHYLGCYCTTVFKRLTPLAGCAVITTRHILTTATSTELVLQRYRKWNRIDSILGAWYDHDANQFNSSLYMAPARIHYHPRYSWPHQVNISHPLPFRYDLAVWAATHKFLGSYMSLVKTVICQRGGPHWFEYRSTKPTSWDMAHIVGFQYVKAQRKVPQPWYRYVTRSRSTLSTCPKSDWAWYHCLSGNQWGKYGVESGAAWHRQLEGRFWSFDGLIGMCAFTMKLRHTDMIHYFTVLNSHPVLDFLYSAYMGRQRYEFLDWRFWDTQWQAPHAKGWAWIPHWYDYGDPHYSEMYQLPYY